MACKHHVLFFRPLLCFESTVKQQLFMYYTRIRIYVCMMFMSLEGLFFRHSLLNLIPLKSHHPLCTRRGRLIHSFFCFSVSFNKCKIQILYQWSLITSFGVSAPKIVCVQVIFHRTKRSIDTSFANSKHVNSNPLFVWHFNRIPISSMNRTLKWIDSSNKFYALTHTCTHTRSHIQR